MANTTADLLTSVQARAFWPSSGAPLTDAQILTLANEELRDYVFPFVLQARSEYRLADLDHSITSSTQLYRCPPRAHAGRLSDVLYVDTNSNETSLDRMWLEEVGNQGQLHGTVASSIGRDYQWFFKGDFVGLYPTPSTTADTLRLRYYMRPGKLVTEAAAGQITAITGATLTIATVPATWTTANTFDLVSATGTHATLAIDLAAGTVNTGASADIDLSVAPTSELAVGDWIALAGESPIPNIPEAVHSLLYHRTVIRMMEGAGDLDKWKLANAATAGYEDAARKLLSDRIDGEPDIIMPNYSALRTVHRGTSFR